MKEYKIKEDKSVDVSWYLSRASLLDRAMLFFTFGKLGRSHYVCMETITTEFISVYHYGEKVKSKAVRRIVMTTERDKSKSLHVTNRYRVLRER